MPSAVFLFIYLFEIRHMAETVMRFRMENIEDTPRQIQNNEFLIRISKDPLKPNLRKSVAVWVLFVCFESMMLADVVW